MDVTQKMKKAMSKEEVSLLIDLIQMNPLLTTKETNATTNKSKDDAWTNLTHNFNAKNGNFPKTKEQLKLKWDNLKKAARKRSQQIRMNNLKTGGGKPDFIPPDEILEKVSSILGSTCTGFEVLFGGDAIGCGSQVMDLGGTAEVSAVADVDIASHNDISTEEGVALADLEVITETPCRDSQEKSVKNSKYFFGVPLSKQLTNKKGKKKPTSEVQMSTINRNLAIASYYDKKREKLDLEIKLLKLELAQKEKDTAQ